MSREDAPTCSWCGSIGTPIGNDYISKVFKCTKCDHEWQEVENEPR